MTKYILKKKIEGIDWEAGEILETDECGAVETKSEYRILAIDLHNLLLNGTIEKVEENKRWRADSGNKYFLVNELNIVVRIYDTYSVGATNQYMSGNYFQTEAQAQAVANQIKELLIKSHGEHN